ncbi:MAG: EAL domain-containing protein [Negativicutes bacterium]|nr:EAL domain-containing protein [Negativicutes bacterium]
MAGKILLIEESNNINKLVQSMLSDFEIVFAFEPLEAIEKIRGSIDIELVLLDLDLPDYGAFNILAEIKKLKLDRKVRTVVLTRDEQIEDEAKALCCGAGDYVRKPFSSEGLRARIEVQLEILRQQNQHDQNFEERDFLFKTIFEQAPIGIVISRSSKPSAEVGEYNSDVNPMYEKITGRSQEEFNKLGWPQITHPEDLSVGFAKFKQLQDGIINGYEVEKRYIRPDGGVIWANLSVSAIRFNEERSSEHVCLVQDITERKKAEAALAESERSKSVLLSHLPGMAYRCKYDREWTMQFVSDGCYELTGYKPESLLNNKIISFNDIIAPHYRKNLWQKWENKLQKKASFRGEYEIITATGESKWVLEMGQGLYDETGKVEALEGIIIDITDKKNYELELEYIGGHDQFTGLYNLRSLQKSLEKDRGKNKKTKSALVLLSLNKISAINSTHGYNFSQNVVKDIADKLSVLASEKRTPFRIFFDKLVFYLADYDDRQEIVDFCDAVIAIMNKTQIMQVIGCGMGIAELDLCKLDLTSILINVSKAAEYANKNSAFGYYFVDEKLIEAINRTTDIKDNLIAIVNDSDNSNIFLEYQPVLNLKNNQIDGFEALARMRTEKMGKIAPCEFIPLAEQMQLIVPIGLKIMRMACTFLQTLQTAGYHNTTIAVNVSAIQFFRAEFVDDIIKIIAETNINSSNLCIEITESVFLGNYEEVNAKMETLQKMGIKIAIDDFGVGYSSLAREGELNIDYLKIDKSFIDKLLKVEPEKAIAGDIISIAHKRGHIVLAEGVEYEEQKRYLIEHNCDYMQGFLFSKPIAPEAALALLAKTNGVL